MKVLKFGGTSVGTVESIKNVKKIVEQCCEPVIVVVSALGGITDKLIETANKACNRDESYKENMQAIRERHMQVIAGVVPQTHRNEIEDRTGKLLDELENIYHGIFLIKDLSPKTLNAIVSYGERLSSTIIKVIKDAELFDSREYIKTVPQFNKHIVDFDTTNRLIREHFCRLPRVALLPGFISADKNTDDTTNLGRGGSDYTAAILAAALNADKLEIWTDVDGFMTADPRVINSAYVIDHLSFTEAMELCNFGAKVIYPPTIYPVFHKNIPIVIKNTFNPDAPGTLISNTEQISTGKTIKGISSINDTSLITVTGLGMVGVVGINSRIFNALARSGVSVFLVSQASSENNTTFAVRNADADLAVEVLNKEFATEIALGEISPARAEKGLATVAIVGENMKNTPGIAGKLFGTLGRSGINIIACAQGAQEKNISFVIESNSLRKALNAIHDSFFLSTTQALNLFVMGVGSVGGDLLKQIAKQQKNLLKNKALNLRVVGIANSKKCIFDRNGLEPERYQELLEKSETASSPEYFKEQILQMNIFNAVFVDCTDSADVAALYYDLLDNNVSVVAANKIATSGSYESYTKLKEAATRRDVKFLFETNVGAGLPIINTINALINSGDSIQRIEAVLSGSLNFIFNTINEQTPLSRAIEMAREAGYSEPDPRIDLSGQDVVRKLVILTREAGYITEQSDVVCSQFIPKEYFEGSLEHFKEQIKNLDDDFEMRRRQLSEEGKRMRYVASFANGKAEVGLQAVDSRHPFYHLEGSNNVILITTERYKEYPMIIKGYGAGSAVTAAGVFADIISIANIR